MFRYHSSALLAVLCLLIVDQAVAHPAFTGRPLGTTFPEASSFVYGTELDVYDRYDTTIMQGIGMHGGDPLSQRTVKMILYTPPVVVPMPHHIPGWTTKTYPCVSEGALQCDGWNIVEMSANSWQDAVNNTDAYYWDIGFNFRNHCECTHPTACEIVPGEDGTEQYRMWFPLVQVMSNRSSFPYDEGDITPTQAVFWTYDSDVQKYGVLKGGKPILDFSEQPLFIRNETEGGLQGYANGKRALQGFVVDWNRCDYMTFGAEEKKISPVFASFTDLENSQMFDDASNTVKDVAGNVVVAPVPGATVVYQSEQTNKLLIVVALGISVLSLVVAVSAIAYSCLVVKSAHSETSSQASNAKAML